MPHPRHRPHVSASRAAPVPEVLQFRITASRAAYAGTDLIFCKVEQGGGPASGLWLPDDASGPLKLAGALRALGLIARAARFSVEYHAPTDLYDFMRATRLALRKAPERASRWRLKGSLRARMDRDIAAAREVKQAGA